MTGMKKYTNEGKIFNVMELPEEIIAYIFSFLPLTDKCNAFTVCKSWNNIMMSYPTVWTNTEIRCEAGAVVPQQFTFLLPLVRHLKLSISMTEMSHQRTGLLLLQQALARGDGHLQTLCVNCLGNPPLFYSGQGLLQGLVDKLTDGSKLTTLDMRGVPFTLNNSFVRSIAMLCRTLKNLFINNTSLVCGVSAETVRKVLKLCPNLTTLGVFQASLSQDVLKDLLLSPCPRLKQFELRCERSLKYVAPLCDQIWTELSQRYPKLRVDLELDHTLPELNVPGVLQPSIPVRHLRLHTWTWLLEEVQKVAQNYANTLEVLHLQTTPSFELNMALVTLATRCTKLQEVHCYCVVSEEVIKAFCGHCPDLQRYTLKTHKEPHPWTCTNLK